MSFNDNDIDYIRLRIEEARQYCLKESSLRRAVAEAVEVNGGTRGQKGLARQMGLILADVYGYFKRKWNSQGWRNPPLLR